MPGAVQFTEPRLLLVEGRDEVGFFSGFLSFLNIDDVQIVNYGGKDSLSINLRSYVLEPTFALVQSIGIVRDADNNPGAARQSVLSSLNNADLPEPSGNDIVKVSVFVIPDDSSPGALEDLCLSALADNSVIHCIDYFLKCVADAGFSPASYTAKARIRAFLASTEDSETRLGIRSLRSDGQPWDWTHPAFNDLAQFLRNL